MIKFPKPKGFEAPEGIKEGQYFEVLATVCAEGNDMLSLHEIDGNPIEAKGPKAEDEPKPKNMDERLSQGVDQMMPPGTDANKQAIPRSLLMGADGGGAYG